MHENEICLICNKPGYHWDVAQFGFTCQFVDGKKVIVFDSETGNEKVL